MPESLANAKAVLGAVPLFAGLPTRHLSAVAKLAKPVEHSPGRELAAQGRGSLAFHVITSGSATVSVNGVPRRTLGAGDYFGEISLLDGQPRSATVTTGPEGLTTLTLTRTDFLGLVEGEPSLSRELIIALCGRIRALEQSL
jgi:CRP/FNR family cyclic AMP-dependent transcriptional regulator